VEALKSLFPESLYSALTEFTDASMPPQTTLAWVSTVRFMVMSSAFTFQSPSEIHVSVMLI